MIRLKHCGCGDCPVRVIHERNNKGRFVRVIRIYCHINGDFAIICRRGCLNIPVIKDVSSIRSSSEGNSLALIDHAKRTTCNCCFRSSHCFIIGSCCNRSKDHIVEYKPELVVVTFSKCETICVKIFICCGEQNTIISHFDPFEHTVTICIPRHIISMHPDLQTIFIYIVLTGLTFRQTI